MSAGVSHPAIADQCKAAIHLCMTRDLKGFDWTLVRSFLAVVEAGSLMGAARATGAQQPTLSRHVTELEAQLGAPLFERTGRGVTPTAMALAIVDAARHMQQGADALSRALAGQRAQTTGTVRITTSMVAATYLMPPLLAELHAQEPGIQLELTASNEIANLLRRDADIAVRMVRPVQSSLVARKLGMVGVGAYAHERYLQRAGTPLAPAELRAHTLIGFVSNNTIERGFDALGMPLARTDFALRTDDQVAYGRLIAEGAGIGFVAHYNVRHWPGVRRVLPALAIPPLPCWLAVHREIKTSKVVRRVYDYLAQALPRVLEEAEGLP